MGLFFYAAVPVVLAPLVAVAFYNGLVARRNAVSNAFASVDAQLQKRYDLVPNLVATVKGYVRHERELLELVTRLRNDALQSPDAQVRKNADDQLSKVLPQLLVVAESYPALRASENFLYLQKSLNEVEEQLAAARRNFNSCVTEYNNAVELFPSSLIAGAFGFKKTDWFRVSDAERKAPSLSGQF